MDNKHSISHGEHKSSVWLAPMMGYTHGWFRSMVQALHPGVQLMTEMVTAQTLRYAQHPSLWIHSLEKNTALQIAAGSVASVQAILPLLAELPFTHINLNAGCPSAQVGQGCMGAAMMRHPALTRDILLALRETGKTVSLKTRLGVDDASDAQWEAWLETVLTSGIENVFLHARSAWLSGLNPAQNRHIPPLRYERALEIFEKYPHVSWVVNGGIQTVDTIQYWRQQKSCTGVMLGRIAYGDPAIFWKLAVLDAAADSVRLRQWCDSVEEQPLCARKITALLALTKGLPAAKAWRQSLVTHKGRHYTMLPLYEAVVAEQERQKS